MQLAGKNGADWLLCLYTASSELPFTSTQMYQLSGIFHGTQINNKGSIRLMEMDMQCLPIPTFMGTAFRFPLHG